MGTHLQSAPRLVERAEQPYVAVRDAVTMQTIGQIADRMPEVFGWLAEHGVEPAGPPFFKYDVIDMERELQLEVGVPVTAAQQGSGDITDGVLPEGRYATVTHVGHPDDLVHATAGLLEWAERHGLEWDMTDGPDGEHWRCRLEIYHDDPQVQPDMSKWTTDLVFRLADGFGAGVGP
jgi:effector-binding domain-containing protein